jgi:hypothetical protein
MSIEHGLLNRPRVGHIDNSKTANVLHLLHGWLFQTCAILQALICVIPTALFFYILFRSLLLFLSINVVVVDISYHQTASRISGPHRQCCHHYHHLTSIFISISIRPITVLARMPSSMYIHTLLWNVTEVYFDQLKSSCSVAIYSSLQSSICLSACQLYDHTPLTSVSSRNTSVRGESLANTTVEAALFGCRGNETKGNIRHWVSVTCDDATAQPARSASTITHRPQTIKSVSRTIVDESGLVNAQ